MADSYTATVALRERMAFDATTTSGFTVPLDAAPEVGGRNAGPRPMEMILVALGGCTGMDVTSILAKMKQDVTDYRVEVEGEKSQEHPKVYTQITVEHVVTGRSLKEDSVRRAVELSATRYCPVSAMLSKSVPVTHRYRMVDSVTAAETVGNI